MHAVTKERPQGWRTPFPIFMALHREFNFTVDAAASPENALLKRFWTEDDDALKQDWAGERVFCNPPWGQIPKFLAKGLIHQHTAFMCFLLPASTDTAWYHDLAKHYWKENFRGRVQYVPPPGVKKSQPPAGSMLCLLGPGWLPANLGVRTRCGKSGIVLAPS